MTLKHVRNKFNRDPIIRWGNLYGMIMLSMTPTYRHFIISAAVQLTSTFYKCSWKHSMKYLRCCGKKPASPRSTASIGEAGVFCQYQPTTTFYPLQPLGGAPALTSGHVSRSTCHPVVSSTPRLVIPVISGRGGQTDPWGHYAYITLV